MNRITFYSSTDLPATQGRRAHHYYEPIAASFNRQGWEANIVLPSTEAHNNLVEHLAFTHLDAFLRWLDEGNTDVLCVWTCKPGDEYVARYARRLGLKVIYAELGWFPQATTIHFDPKGTGPQSSLVDWKPEFQGDFESVNVHKGDEGKPTGIVGQVESDWNMQSSQWRWNGEFVAHLLQVMPEERFIFRPHPLQQDVHLPESPRLEIVRGGKLKDFFDGCWRIMGINSTALLEALELDKPVYQFGRGIGHNSGAFVQNGKRSPLAAAVLLRELQLNRQIDVRPGMDIDAAVRDNAVLGPMIGGDSDNLRAVGRVCQEA